MQLAPPGARPARARRLLAQMLCALALLIAAPAAASAQHTQIFFNGSDVTGSPQLNNRTFKNVTISFDGKGNAYITAPSYVVKIKPGPKRPPVAPAAAPPPARMPPRAVAPTSPVPRPKKKAQPPTKRYFAKVTSHDASLIGCRVQVLFNRREVASFSGLDRTLAREITWGLARGRHELLVRARRPPNAAADPSEVDPKRLRDAFLEVQVGPGTLDGDSANLIRPLATFRCSDRTGGFVERSFTIDVE